MRNHGHVGYIQCSKFGELKEIGSGGYGTVYTAKYRGYPVNEDIPETVVLKQLKSFDEMPELFISEVSSYYYSIIIIKVIFNLTCICFYLIVQK